MRGVTFPGNRQAEIREFPNPQAGPGEAVLKVKASGLCGTDLHRYRGSEPTDMITGHEPCGVIEELSPGAPPGIKVGDRVICHHYAGCGVCENCSMGYEQLCPQGRITFGGGTGHGANADYIVVPSRSLVLLDDELSFEEGAAISCGTGTAWNGLKKMEIPVGTPWWFLDKVQ
jgi:D-arabinose 1-dehydrogenase-like Zn-dependent alcohol dehydrogenase